MNYIAHTITGTTDEQSLQDHLEGTARLAKQFADVFGYGDWGYCCGKLHDIGKYSDKFQRRIRNSGEKTDYATAGAQLCKQLGGHYQWLAYCIAGHHGGMPDTGGSTDTADRPTMEGRMKKKIEDYSAYKQEIDVPKLNPSFFLKSSKTDPSFTISFFIRMLYSCLVDADFLNTEWFMQGVDSQGNKGEKAGCNLRKPQCDEWPWKCRVGGHGWPWSWNQAQARGRFGPFWTGGRCGISEKRVWPDSGTPRSGDSGRTATGRMHMDEKMYIACT